MGFTVIKLVWPNYPAHISLSGGYMIGVGVHLYVCVCRVSSSGGQGVFRPQLRISAALYFANTKVKSKLNPETCYQGIINSWLCYSLLPARASEQGNVIGSVRIYIYIYMCVCTKRNCN